MIPEFDENGNLPPGIHFCEWEDFKERFGTNLTRDRLIKGLSRAMAKLKAAGCRIIYINGSPSIPVLYNLAIGRSDQKSIYGGDIFPASYPADEAGKNYLDFFKFNSRSNTRKGIITIDLQRWEYDD
ncbi:MAG: hypothetical protein GDA43_03385 [Hormoscilla sp. SP5CHS1]|nr:hypothetical protein [Hormoscilla sp. SP12CHS1]MBC6452351.1 hypothetical protein [Hormoscilla sp. SP5CHS1]